MTGRAPARILIIAPLRRPSGPAGINNAPPGSAGVTDRRLGYTQAADSPDGGALDIRG